MQRISAADHLSRYLEQSKLFETVFNFEEPIALGALLFFLDIMPNWSVIIILRLGD
ncbi:MAG: hypothetical protein RM049_24475 [Nostoc sp. DedQUE04]|uniref:hypothetical protein n=1 Tax=Nostoc sp. DedQUE04 TaxID=3075390 RepID=UPI002AD27D1A|nr:hypothetical protein [Nostoc sp. DedQUE04]MDZ8138425.1 hypothetical protein [Nostoc sp. DedQUE04]